MRFDINSPNFFDWWRDNYESITDEEHQQIANLLEAKYPDQAHFNSGPILEMFNHQEKSSAVLEIGGWKGHLAKEMLAEFGPGKIYQWHNYEACLPAIEKSVVSDKRYQSFHKPEFRWFSSGLGYHYDILIATHVIEHFCFADFLRIVSFKGIPTIYFEAPLEMTGQKWSGYLGTHKLEEGWMSINNIMSNLGYEINYVNDSAFMYKLKR